MIIMMMMIIDIYTQAVFHVLTPLLNPKFRTSFIFVDSIEEMAAVAGVAAEEVSGGGVARS